MKISRLGIQQSEFRSQGDIGTVKHVGFTGVPGFAQLGTENGNKYETLGF